MKKEFHQFFSPVQCLLSMFQVEGKKESLYILGFLGFQNIKIELSVNLRNCPSNEGSEWRLQDRD